MDISKCSDKECPSKDTCWRWLAPADDDWQSYSDFDRKGEEKCEDYWEEKPAKENCDL